MLTLLALLSANILALEGVTAARVSTVLPASSTQGLQRAFLNRTVPKSAGEVMHGFGWLKDPVKSNLETQSTVPEFHPARILVGLSGVNLTKASVEIASLNLTLAALCQHGDVGLLNVLDGADPRDRIAELDCLRTFAYAELDYRLHFNSPPLQGIDLVQGGSRRSLWRHQYGPRLIRADRAWERGARGEGIVVALMDTGVDISHPDLRNSLWTNEAELHGQSGVDDDGNGFVDDIHGWNWVHNSANITSQGNPHGTHVAGIIAAAHGGPGIKGVAPGARIMVLEFLDDDGKAYMSQSLAAIDYGIRNGANIFSHSWGSDVHKLHKAAQSVKNALRASAAQGVLHIASAGNSAADLDNPATPNNLPCTFHLPNVVCVAASDARDSLAGFSNFGRHSAHIAAPGDAILSLAPGGRYGFMSGTSMATPHVAGVSALIMSEFLARNESAAKLETLTREVLLHSADIVPGLHQRISEDKRLNALNAIISVQEGKAPLYPSVPPSSWSEYYSIWTQAEIAWESLVNAAAGMVSFLLRYH